MLTAGIEGHIGQKINFITYATKLKFMRRIKPGFSIRKESSKSSIIPALFHRPH
jgi:hypothetical protein